MEAWKDLGVEKRENGEEGEWKEERRSPFLSSFFICSSLITILVLHRSLLPFYFCCPFFPPSFTSFFSCSLLSPSFVVPSFLSLSPVYLSFFHLFLSSVLLHLYSFLPSSTSCPSITLFCLLSFLSPLPSLLSPSSCFSFLPSSI